MSRRSSGSRRLGRRRARSYPHPDGRGPQPGAKARSAHGPETEIDRGAAERGPPPTRRRCHARRTGAQLRRRQEHNFTTRIMTVNPQIELVRLAVAIMMIFYQATVFRRFYLETAASVSDRLYAGLSRIGNNYATS